MKAAIVGVGRWRRESGGVGVHGEHATPQFRVSLGCAKLETVSNLVVRGSTEGALKSCLGSDSGLT